MTDHLYVTSGSVSVMGLMNDRENRVRLVIDRTVTNAGWFACRPCVNTSPLFHGGLSEKGHLGVGASAHLCGFAGK